MAAVLSFSVSVSHLTITNSPPFKEKSSRSEMVPIKDLMKGLRTSHSRKFNGEKVVVNGESSSSSSSSDRKKPTLARVNQTKAKESFFTEQMTALPSAEGFSWAREDYNSWQRTVDIWSFVIGLRMRFLLDNAKWAYVGGFTEEKKKIRRRRTACWVRERVLQLGPTFIKLGQLISSRSDLFPRELVDELSKLQDRVPAFPSEKARDFIENELGAPIETLFKEFEDLPIAAASLGQEFSGRVSGLKVKAIDATGAGNAFIAGILSQLASDISLLQVHQAILHNGERVVVKVQRPGLKKLLDIDLRNLKLVAEYFQKSDTYGGPTKDWVGIYEECSKILYQEIDYLNEGKNADRFRRDFRNVKWIRIPLVLWDFTSTKVLTLEYVPGVKVNNLDQIDAQGYSRSQIATYAIESYLMQVLNSGFFHADPHPGNLAVDIDGSLIYYDFGMMGEIKSHTRERLLELFYAVYEKDTNKVITCLVNLEALRPTGDMSPVRRSINFFLDNLLASTPDQQQTLTSLQFFLDNLLTSTPDQQQTFAAIGEDLFAIATDQTFHLPSAFAFVLKAFSTLEGIGHELDPNFSAVKLAAPYAQGILKERQRQNSGTVVDGIRKQVDDAGNSAISMPYRVQQIEKFFEQLESGDLKLRVRVLESERAAWKATILQMATIYTTLGGTLLNVGVTLSSQGQQDIANGCFSIAGVFLILLIISMRRVSGLDKIEKMLKE